MVNAPFVPTVRPSEELLRQSEEVLTSPVPTFDVGPSRDLTPEGRSRTRQITIGTMPYLFDPGTGRVFRMDGSAVTEEEQARANEIIESSPETQAQIEAPELATQTLFEDQARRALRDYERAVETGSPSGVERARERLDQARERLTSPTPPFRPAETEETVIAEETTQPPARSMTEEEILRSAPQMEAEAEADDAVRVADQPLVEQHEIDRDLFADPNETPEDLRSRYEDRLKLFQEVLGGADEQTAQDKAMQLAMIGLAIAAGQSPDALTNISQGALAGLTSMSEQEAERRAQDREMRAAALEAAIEDVNLGRRLASDERIAAIRAGEAGESSRQEYLFNSTFQTTYDYLVNTEQLDPATAVQRARQAAAAAAPGAPSAQNMSITPEQEAALRERIEAAAGDEAQLTSIRNALTARGLNPSDYGL